MGWTTAWAAGGASIVTPRHHAAASLGQMHKESFTPSDAQAPIVPESEKRAVVARFLFFQRRARVEEEEENNDSSGGAMGGILALLAAAIGFRRRSTTVKK